MFFNKKRDAIQEDHYGNSFLEISKIVFPNKKSSKLFYPLCTYTVTMITIRWTQIIIWVSVDTQVHWNTLSNWTWLHLSSTHQQMFKFRQDEKTLSHPGVFGDDEIIKILLFKVYYLAPLASTLFVDVSRAHICIHMHHHALEA